MKIVLLVITAVFSGHLALSQTNTGNVRQTGSCNAGNSGDNSTVTVTCAGIGKEQGEKIVKILNAALAQGDLMNAKLDELLKLASQPQQTNITQDCPNGICNAGNNNGTQTVINNTPPPADLYYEQQGGGPVWLSPTSPITGAVIGFFFSAPTMPDYGDSTHIGPYLRDENAGMTTGPQFGWGQMITNGALIPNAYVMKLSNPPVFMPSMQLIVTFKGGQLLKICNMSPEFKCLTTAFEAPGMNPLNRAKR